MRNKHKAYKIIIYLQTGLRITLFSKIILCVLL